MKLNRKNLRWGIPALLLVVLALIVLTGCGSTAEPAVTVTATQTYLPPSDDDVFLSEIHGFGNSLIDGMSDYDAIDVAHSTCDMLDSGYTIYDAMNVAAQAVQTQDQAEAIGVVMGIGIKVYCPRHLDQIQTLG